MLIYGSFFFWTRMEEKPQCVVVRVCYAIISIYLYTHISLNYYYYYDNNNQSHWGLGTSGFGFWCEKTRAVLLTLCCRPVIGLSVTMLVHVVTNSHTMISLLLFGFCFCIGDHGFSLSQWIELSSI